IEPLNLAHVAIDVAISASETLPLDSVLAGIVGGGHKPELSFEPPYQIRKVCNSASNVFFDQKTVGHAEGEGGRRRELHDPCRARSGKYVRTPGRFDVNYGLHELQGNAVRPRIVIGPTHLGIEHGGRWSRCAGGPIATGGTA